MATATNKSGAVTLVRPQETASTASTTGTRVETTYQKAMKAYQQDLTEHKGSPAKKRAFLKRAVAAVAATPMSETKVRAFVRESLQAFNSTGVTQEPFRASADHANIENPEALLTGTLCADRLKRAISRSPELYLNPTLIQENLFLERSAPVLEAMMREPTGLNTGMQGTHELFSKEHCTAFLQNLSLSSGGGAYAALIKTPEAQRSVPVEPRATMVTALGFEYDDTTGELILDDHHVDKVSTHLKLRKVNQEIEELKIQLREKIMTQLDAFYFSQRDKVVALGSTGTDLWSPEIFFRGDLKTQKSALEEHSVELQKASLMIARDKIRLSGPDAMPQKALNLNRRILALEESSNTAPDRKVSKLLARVKDLHAHDDETGQGDLRLVGILRYLVQLLAANKASPALQEEAMDYLARKKAGLLAKVPAEHKDQIQKDFNMLFAPTIALL